MHNSDGVNIDLYIPRKCTTTNRLISAKDKASVQLNIGHVSADGAASPLPERRESEGGKGWPPVLVVGRGQRSALFSPRIAAVSPVPAATAAPTLRRALGWHAFTPGEERLASPVWQRWR